MPDMPYMIWKEAVSDSRIKNIVERGEATEAEKATTFGGDGFDYRRSTVSWLTGDSELQNYLFRFVQEANKYWGFHVENTAEIQYTRYDGNNHDHYGWHSDVDWFSSLQVHRKVSITVQLSNPDEYEGGDFELEGAGIDPDYKNRGTVLVFPSYLQHKVNPVLSGTRHSLVAWFEGPQWR